jgi:UDP-glucuronate 4-epimerase
MKKVLLTGIAGFIGFHTARKLLLQDDIFIVGVDSFDDYYDVSLKRERINELRRLAPDLSSLEILEGSIADSEFISNIFDQHSFSFIINLAAQAGVRYSLINPQKYIESNIVGFTNLLEATKQQSLNSEPIEHFLYASTSSVYGASNMMPFSEQEPVSHPLQFYAATKRANELIAHSYSSLYNIPTSGMRFFTVYGPWGRPDMALFLFTKNILNCKPIDVFNNGQHSRDFTYVDDIVDGILLIMRCPATPTTDWNYLNLDTGSSYSPYSLYNIGNSTQIPLIDYIKILEKKLDKKAIMNMLPLQPGDVENTSSDISKLKSLGYEPKVSVEDGISNFVDWYKSYYKEVQ